MAVIVYWAQFLASIIACLSTVSDGLHGSWTSPSLPKLMAPDSYLPITQDDVNMIELIYLIGGIAGLPFTMWSVDKFGRKYTVLFAAASNCVTWIGIYFVTDVYVLLAIRFLAGFNSDVAFVSIPMYISEMADKNIRGFLVSMIYIMLLIGYQLCYSVAPFVSISDAALVGLAFVTLQLIAFPFFPETPYYYLLRHSPEKASKSLQFFRRANEAEVEKELEELKLAVDRQSQERGRFKDVFIVKSNRRGLIIMTALNGAQHLAGITVILMKLHTILGNSSGFLSANSTAIIFSVIMLLFSFISASIVDRFGRKVLLIFSCITTAVTLAALAGFMNAAYVGVEVSHLHWIPVAAVFSFAAVYRLGLGSVPIVVTGEIFPTSVKAMAMTMSDAMYVIVGTLVMYMFQELDKAFGMHVPFYLFAVCSFGMAVFVYFYMPETKGKTLEQIQLMMKGLKEGDYDTENMTPLREITRNGTTAIESGTSGS